MKGGFYNSRKKKTLEALAGQKWLDVPSVARLAGITPTRRAYAYLTHLAEFDLIIQGRDKFGKLYYRITDRGIRRLEWLQSHTPPGPIEELVQKFLRLN